MTLWKRLAAEAAANRGKTVVLGVLTLGLLASLSRHFLPQLTEELATTIGLVTPPPMAPTGDAYWKQTTAADDIAYQPVSQSERLRNAFAINAGQFPPPVLFAADPAPVAPVPEPIEDDELIGPIAEDDAADFPDIVLQGTTASRLAVLSGRVIRRGNSFPIGETRYTLSRVGDGWAIVTDADGNHFKLTIRPVYRATERPTTTR